MKLRNAILISFASILFISLFIFFGVFSNINLKLSDGLYGSKTALNNIVIIGIDDQSLQEIGRWPWGRDVIAQAINNLEQSKVIGIDVGFFEQSDPEEDSILVDICF